MLPLFLAASVLAQPALSDGRELVRAMYENDGAAAWAKSSASMKARVKSPSGMRKFLSQLSGSTGPERRLISEQLVPKGDGALYSRTAAVAYWARGMTVDVLLDGAGQLTAMTVRAPSVAAPNPHEQRVPNTRLRLPFRGAFNVLWGGRSYADNKHAAVPDQRYALDLVMYPGKNTFIGDGTHNEQYGCWGAPVVAPADGTVVAVVDGVVDNQPNKIRSVDSLFGNLVVVDHGGGEYSLMGHLQNASVQVAVGDTVEQGQLLARVGSSGMSTEPHLHYQLMDSADWRKAHGLPQRFHGFTRNGSSLEVGEVRRGDVLMPATMEARR